MPVGHLPEVSTLNDFFNERLIYKFNDKYWFYHHNYWINDRIRYIMTFKLSRIYRFNYLYPCIDQSIEITCILHLNECYYELNNAIRYINDI